jgi:Ala-tRNA(Pro) deacylase
MRKEDAMTVLERSRVQASLDGRGITYETIPHAGTYTTLAEAKALHIPADEVLKTVVLREDDGFAIAIIPASCRLDMSRVHEVIPARDLRLATEEEIEAAFPEFELGALPAVPELLGYPAYIDPKVFEHETVAFAAGTQTESIVTNPHKLLWDPHVFVAAISTPLEDFG